MPLDNRTCFQVNLRDALRCQCCSKRPHSQGQYHRGFEYHHVQPKSQGGPDTVENVALLCHDCHLHQHRGTEAHVITVRPSVDRFICNTCGQSLDPQTVEMNCGWYRCDACQMTTHLYDHFYGSDSD